MVVHILLKVEQVLLQIFRIKIILNLVLFFGIMNLTTAEVFAEEDYLRYYSENKKDIFNSIEKPFILNNYVYSVSIVENLDEIVVIDRLRSKSELMAIGNITRNNPKKIQIDSKQYISIDNGLISEDEPTKYFFSVIVFKKSYLDSIFNIDINNVFFSLKR